MRGTTAALALAAIITFAGCAGTDQVGTGGPPAEAPVWRVGDRWVYRVTDGFRAPLSWNETHEVVSVAPGVITVRVTEAGPSARGPRTEIWTRPGLLAAGPVFDNETRRFTPPVAIYAFPMSPGQRWGGWVDNFNETAQQAAQINRTVSVGNWTRVETPAGTFDALPLRVLMRLDDQEFWRGPTEANYLVHYAPAAGAMVRADKNAHFVQSGRGGFGAVTTQRAQVELTSYTRATP
ncbi:MAG: hypothetical protein ABW071_02790 [Casimicrobiaceae bacterium]